STCLSYHSLRQWFPIKYVLTSTLILQLLTTFFLFSCPFTTRDLHSFPTRRSSDLLSNPKTPSMTSARSRGILKRPVRPRYSPRGDRKSTRLNSSHVSISYAVFCLKKKK